ncbi:MAG TPA: pyridoxal-phosphate dependent enzyme [Thermomicrobiales bacterium]|nr:pyridoxal-phosphate dependent enzyme [Thermomicrobiales bacterium]
MTAMTSLIPTMEEVLEGRARQQGVIVRTPLLQLHGSETIWIKPEVLQPVGSFKMRGIYNAVAALSVENRAKGVSTVSSGNTAQALAWSARRFGVRARAIMPETAPLNKIRATEAYGGVPDLMSAERAFGYLRDGGYHDFEDTFIHPVANRVVIAGHGSLALEIHEDMPDVETVYVPMGGGGLISGVANALKQLTPTVRVVGVQPSGCTPIAAGLAAGHSVDVPVNTFCDGIAVGFMFPEMYPLLRDLVDDVVIVDEADVPAAIRHLALKNKIVTEGAGALAVAAALRAGNAVKAIAVVSGGSIDAEAFARIISAE